MPGKSYREKWSEIFKHLRIDCSNRLYLVSARTIKDITGKEPRNMAYIDSQDELPSIFARYGAFPLPVTNGMYAIIKGQGFHELEDCGSPQTYEARLPFPLVTLAGRRGEMQQLDYAYNSGLLSHFSGVPDMRLTIRGRQYTPPFAFRVDGTEGIQTKSVQIEVDGGYESRDSVLLFETKIGEPKTFIIRQLYYPLRTWQQLAESKSVRTFFMCSLPDQRSFSMWEYKFSDPSDYESIELEAARAYRVEERPLDPGSVIEVTPSKEKSGVVPQADDIYKILEFPFRVAEGFDTAARIAAHFGFDRRQSSYYREATEALGLVTLSDSRYVLTEGGRQYIQLPPDQRNQFFLRLILDLPIMHETFLRIVQAGRKGLGAEEIASIIRDKSHLSGSTPPRRAQTILAWYRWVENALGIVRLRGRRIFVRGTEWF